MNKSGQIYTLGMWLVKPGLESEFITTWETFARWTAESLSLPDDLGAHLLQDLENPRRFISFGPWKDIQTVQAWRGLPEFMAFFSKARELCEKIEPSTLKQVAIVPGDK